MNILKALMKIVWILLMLAWVMIETVLLLFVPISTFYSKEDCEAMGVEYK